MTTHEPRYKWWEGVSEYDRWILYIFHLVHDCNIPVYEAVPLAENNFNVSVPDPIDQLLESP